MLIDTGSEFVAVDFPEADSFTKHTLALAPLLEQLRGDDKSINAIAAEPTPAEIEARRGGAQWRFKSARRLFELPKEEMQRRDGQSPHRCS